MDQPAHKPDPSAVGAALWRAMHLQVDAPPPVFEDEIGLQLVAPDEGWRQHPDMELHVFARARATMVARGRFVEDLVIEQARVGVRQYVILGAGLDTFAQRCPEVASTLRIFEVDQPGPQAWKRQRLVELGFGIPDWLRLVPVNFESGSSWLDESAAAGFDATQPAIVASCGVTQYLSREAVAATLRQIATLAAGSILVMTFVLPLDLVEPEELPVRRTIEERARASAVPWISFFSPEEVVALAGEAGLNPRHVSSAGLTARYFAGRPDGLRPMSTEQFLLATV